MSGSFKCSTCYEQFSRSSRLYQHQRTVHFTDDPVMKRLFDVTLPNAKGLFSCDLCPGVYRTRKYLNVHITKKHLRSSTKSDQTAASPELCRPKPRKIKCSECGAFLPDHKLYRFHLKEKHNMEMQHEEKEFSSLHEFQTWKTCYEKETRTQYALTTGVKRSTLGAKYYYQCHRSGKHLSKSKGKHRMTIDTIKMDRTCPSLMTVTETSGGVHVLLWKTHCNHARSVGHLSLSGEERDQLAGTKEEMTEQEVEVECIVYEPEDPPDLQLPGGRKHPSDAISVQLWVQSMNQLDVLNYPVVLYKPQGVDDPSRVLNKEDFFLVIMTPFQKQMFQEFDKSKICIDSTLGTNFYDFDLITLMTVDKYGSGCPGAFCFTNRKDSVAWNMFYRAVRDITGRLETEVFVSNDDPSLYKAWEEVMGRPTHRLLCTWHVNKNCRKNINEKIDGSNEAKALVYEALKEIMQETDTVKFENLEQKFIRDLADDPATKEFATYFLNFYSHRAQMWAFCYRAHIAVNTSTCVESLHKVFKHFYLLGKRHKRMDACISALIRFSTDQVFECTTKVGRNNRNAQRSIQASHKFSGLIPDSMITTLEEDSMWEVTSLNIKELEHIVYKYTDNSCSPNCRLVCSKCNICVHMYICTCVNNLIKFNICKHIHACARKSAWQSLANRDLVEGEDDTVIEEPPSDAVEHNAVLHTTTNHTRLIEKVNLLMECVTSSAFSEKHILIMDKKLSSFIEFAEKCKKTLLTETDAKVDNEPSNKTATLQQSDSTKRNLLSRTNVVHSKSRKRQQPNVSESSSDEAHQLINVHTAFDHLYE